MRAVHRLIGKCVKVKLICNLHLLRRLKQNNLLHHIARVKINIFLKITKKMLNKIMNLKLYKQENI